MECDAVITMDADLQHDPVEIPHFVAERSRCNADFVIGYRKRLGSGMPIHRIMSNTITTALVWAKTGVKVRDSQSGYRLITRRVLSSITVESDGYEAETEILIKAARKGFRFAFIPIATIYGGAKSHMTHWWTTKQFLKVLLKEYE
jgi:glycosyltransferase involved in cell wall biosynthesis